MSIRQENFELLKKDIIKIYSYLEEEIPINLILNINDIKTQNIISRAFLLGLINSKAGWEENIKYEK